MASRKVIVKTGTALQLPLFIPAPEARERGWINYGDRVVVVCIDASGNKIQVVTGYICSTAESHFGADNIEETVVWSDEPFNPDADNADDALERPFKVKDPHLIKREEMVSLNTSKSIYNWFGGGYSLETCEKICKMFSECNFDRQDRFAKIGRTN